MRCNPRKIGYQILPSGNIGQELVLLRGSPNFPGAERPREVESKHDADRLSGALVGPEPQFHPRGDAYLTSTDFSDCLKDDDFLGSYFNLDLDLLLEFFFSS